MAKLTTSPDLTWREVDPDTLPAGLKAHYNELKQAQRLAAKARDDFEAAFTEMATIPPSQTLFFGYRFGKLSIAIKDEPRPAPKSPRTSALSFADLAGR